MSTEFISRKLTTKFSNCVVIFVEIMLIKVKSRIYEIWY